MYNINIYFSVVSNIKKKKSQIIETMIGSVIQVFLLEKEGLMQMKI